MCIYIYIYQDLPELLREDGEAPELRETSEQEAAGSVRFVSVPDF